MEEKKNEKVIDLQNKSKEELIEIYSKISENILMMNQLLNSNNKEEGINKYQKIKNKI